MGAKIPWEPPRPGRHTLTEWEIEPLRTALLVLDMQRGYVDPAVGMGPALLRFPQVHGYYYPRLSGTVLPNILRLRDFFRGHGLRVVYTRMGLQLPGGRDLPPWSWRVTQVGRPEGNLFPKGSPEYEIIPELAPPPEELVLDKNSASPFSSSPLDQNLRNMGVENLVITGLLTNVAVEGASRDAGDRGFNAMTAEDACAAYGPEEHADALTGASGWVVKTTDEVIDTLGAVLPVA